MRHLILLTNTSSFAFAQEGHETGAAGQETGTTVHEAGTPVHDVSTTVHEAGTVHSGGHEAVEIPWSPLFVQAFNFTVLFGLLFYLLHKTVKAHFAHRAAEYQQLVQRAESARKEAEASKLEVQRR